MEKLTEYKIWKFQKSCEAYWCENYGENFNMKTKPHFHMAVSQLKHCFGLQLAPLWYFILPSGFHTDLMGNAEVLSKETVYTEKLTATIE